jgi:hypothetical protein
MKHLNKREFLKYLAAGVSTVAPASALLAAEKMQSSKKGSGADHTAQLLFVQTARSVMSKGDKLTLHGVAPATLYFSDRPKRIAGHETTREWVDTWSQGDDSFASDPPNATLSVLGGEEVVDDVVVELRDPRLEDDKLTYTVTVLNGKLPASGGASSLFIDIVGRPLTPVSAAGVARRTRRRVIY